MSAYNHYKLEELKMLKRSELKAHRVCNGHGYGEYYYEIWHDSYGGPIHAGHFTSAKEAKDNFMRMARGEVWDQINQTYTTTRK